MPNRFYYINLVLDSSLHVSDAFRALFLHPLLFPHPREPFLLPKHIFLALIEFVLFCDPLSLIRDIWVTRDTGTLPCGLMLTRTYTSEDNLSLDSPPPPLSIQSAALVQWSLIAQSYFLALFSLSSDGKREKTIHWFSCIIPVLHLDPQKVSPLEAPVHRLF